MHELTCSNSIQWSTTSSMHWLPGQRVDRSAGVNGSGRNSGSARMAADNELSPGTPAVAAVNTHCISGLSVLGLTGGGGKLQASSAPHLGTAQQGQRGKHSTSVRGPLPQCIRCLHRSVPSTHPNPKPYTVSQSVSQSRSRCCIHVVSPAHIRWPPFGPCFAHLRDPLAVRPSVVSHLAKGAVWCGRGLGKRTSLAQRRSLFSLAGMSSL